MKLGVCLLALALGGCQPRTPERPACSSAALAVIEANYVASILAACSGHASIEACPASGPIEADFNTQREEWIACR